MHISPIHQTTGPVAPALATNRALQSLALSIADAPHGAITDQDQAALSMVFPDIAAELIAHRRDAIRRELVAARKVIFLRNPPRAALADACDTITRHSIDQSERQAASDILKAMIGAVK